MLDFIFRRKRQQRCIGYADELRCSFAKALAEQKVTHSAFAFAMECAELIENLPNMSRRDRMKAQVDLTGIIGKSSTEFYNDGDKYRQMGIDDITKVLNQQDKRIRRVIDEQYAHGLVLRSLIEALGTGEGMVYHSQLSKELSNAFADDDNLRHKFISEHPILQRGTQKPISL